MASTIPSQPSTSKEPSILKKTSAPTEPPKKCVPEQTDESDRIFIEVLRKNIHYILDVKLNTTAGIIKRMIDGISKIPPENQRIYYEDRIMRPTDTLASIGITKEMASLSKKFVQLGLAIKRYELFEKLEMQPVAEPPELPEVFKEYESELDPKEPDVIKVPSVSSDDGVCPGAATAAAQIAAKRAAARAGPSGEGAGPSGDPDASPAKITKR
ncbi:hypothetical protein TNCT_489121 [Trichonephila clavata]|uniref:Ubiquitin-like domain-containing protein n=1 Tax=Trichonephila clavata TaxID=2740835 RepID=A0A8X6HYV5_TRICU|nr:hypothetical protein TNCT_489121 [Trichonephila clavata]